MGPTALFPSEGRRAEDFFTRKIRRLQPGLNSGTRGQHTYLQTTEAAIAVIINNQIVS